MRWLKGLGIASCLWLFLAAGVCCAEGAPEHPPLWFTVGEDLVYDIHWGIFHVGQTHVTTAWTNFNGHAALRIRYVTRTNKFVENFYPVNDLLESLIDPDSFLPFCFRKKLSEGHYRADELTIFNHEKKEMNWKSFTNGRVKTRPIESDTRDVVTMMYYLRSQPMELSVTNNYRVMADEDIYDLAVAPTREETMKLSKWGGIPCFRVDPRAAFNGLFVRKGKITFWVSKDERRICTRVTASVAVANIRLTLVDVKGPGDDLWVQPKKAKDEEHVH